MANDSHYGAAESGFTLIELLIVIGILGLLATVLLPNVLGARKEGEIAETRARILFCAQAAKAFERKYGYYPPDDFIDPAGKLKVKADPRNAGIESLVVFLCQRRLSTDSLADHQDWLDNTDADDAGIEIPLLGGSAKMEVIDAWGTPLAYFCSQRDGYSRKQTIMLPGSGVTVRADAARNPRTGKPLAPGKFQLVSAGPDARFGTDDDITYPAKVEE